MWQFIQHHNEANERFRKYPALGVINIAEAVLVLAAVQGATYWFDQTLPTVFGKHQPVHTILTFVLLVLSMLSVRFFHPLLRQILRPRLPPEDRPTDCLMPHKGLKSFQQWYLMLFFLLWATLALSMMRGVEPFTAL